MSRVRGISDEKRAAYRKGECRWCEGPVGPPRRTFCSNECIHQWKLRSNPSYRRQHVFKHDGGICAKCGRDCHVLERDLLKMLYANPSACDVTLLKLGLTRKTWDPRRSLWEVDHVVAVVDGGGGCDLTNLQTLCFACHKDKTAELARRRAEKRARVRPPDDLFPKVVPPWDLFDD
jgi:5-methylcytosine-specific restriction enzyme A